MKLSLRKTGPSKKPSKKRRILGLVGWLGVSFVAAGIGAMATMRARDDYRKLEQPEWAPPGGAFAPVWTTLYAMMGTAAWLVSREESSPAQRKALGFFMAQLVLNGLWTWLFFAWRRGRLSFADIVILWGLIVATIVLFWRVRPLAGVLLVPYLLWTSFAAVLNYTVWQLNPEELG